MRNSCASFLFLIHFSEERARIDFDIVPQLNGKDIYDADLDGFEDKPWRKPGSDLSDYFNFGFNETTWRQYCQRQTTLRQENMRTVRMLSLSIAF